jgi:hypothetical protein
MSYFKNKKFFFFQQRYWGLKIGHPIAKRFYKEGAIIGGLVFNSSLFADYKEQKDFKYEWLECYDDIIENADKYLQGSEISLSDICKNLNIESVWPFIQTVREAVKSYKDKYFYGFKQNISDEEILLIIKATYKLIIDINNNFKPDVIILPNFVSLVHHFAYFFAKKNKIKIIGYTYDMITEKILLTRDPLDTDNAYIDRINYYKKNNFDSKFYLDAKEFLEQKREKYRLARAHNVIKNNFFRDFVYVCKKIILILFKLTFLKYKFSKKFGVKMEESHLSLKFLLRDFFYRNYYKYKVNKINYYNLENIKKYAYFCLQYQPEQNVDNTSDLLNNQIEVARQIALNLPDDLTLVVKDHPVMYGKRPFSYLEKVLKTPNVKLISPHYNGIHVIKNCEVLIAPTGTSFHEASILKKPAILLGNWGHARILPNVKKIFHFREIPAAFRELKISSEKWDREDYDKQLLINMSVSYEVGFDYNYKKLWMQNYTNEYDLDGIFQEYVKEIFLTT